MNDTQFYTPLQKNAAYYRARAREMLTGSYGISLLVCFLAILLGGAVTSGITSGINVDLDEMSTPFSSQQFIEYFSIYLPLLIAGAIVSSIVSIAFSLFISSPVMLGYQKFFLALNDRNEEQKSVSTLFSFFASATYWKSVLLNLLHSLILAAAVLPFLAATVVACILLFIPFMLPLALFVFLAGALISAAISLPLSYTYTYAHMIMAEYPTLTPVEALRNSRNLMRGKRWKLFCLDFSFIGWILLSLLTCGIGFFFLAPYMQSARAAFYHDVANRETAKETEFPSLDPNDYTEQ